MTRPKTLDEHNRDIWTFGGWLLAISVLGTIGAVWWWALLGMSHPVVVACRITLATAFVIGLLACITSLLYDEDEPT
jgi:hypothetical protein